MPSHTEGFTGDALNMLLTPPYILDQVENIRNPNEDLSAIRDGRVWDNCSAYVGKCGRSFYKVRRIFHLKHLSPDCVNPTISFAEARFTQPGGHS